MSVSVTVPNLLERDVVHRGDGGAVVGLLEEEPVVVRVEGAVLLGDVAGHVRCSGGGDSADTESSLEGPFGERRED